MKRRFKLDTILSERFIKELHFKMYNEVWTWAGKFRKTNKNIGVDYHQIEMELRKLQEDIAYWIANNTYSSNEVAIRFKHCIVSIHCFSNGNGRHSRLLADVVIENLFGEKVYSWGSSNLVKSDEQRNRYLKAIRQADQGIIKSLIEFARS